eukprot:3897953-Amphidinium_carterae.1
MLPQNVVASASEQVFMQLSNPPALHIACGKKSLHAGVWEAFSKYQGSKRIPDRTLASSNPPSSTKQN